MRALAKNNLAIRASNFKNVMNQLAKTIEIQEEKVNTNKDWLLYKEQLKNLTADLNDGELNIIKNLCK